MASFTFSRNIRFNESFFIEFNNNKMDNVSYNNFDGIMVLCMFENKVFICESTAFI